MIMNNSTYSSLSKALSRPVSLMGLFVAAMLLGGCTRNNGDIGDWFGKWQVMEIRVDGVAETDYEPRYFWEFQNDIIRLVWVGPNGYDRDTYYCFGTWKQPSDNAMVFDFSHSDDSGRLLYRPFSAMHFPGDRPFTLTISDVSGKTCTMKYVEESTSTEYTYLLRKR